MNAKELKNVVLDYAALDCPGYAIMVNGPWGCGKTHFINDVFGPENKKKLYVSLYGIESVSEIEDRLLSALTSVDDVSDSDIGNAGKFFGGLAGVLGLVDGDGSSVGALAATMGSVVKLKILKNISKDKCLIFDDFERAGIDSTKVLSFLNKFIEHQGMNLIVLCDESQLPKDESGRYLSYKEKVVSVTVNLTRSPREIVNILFSSGGGVPEFLQKKSEEELLGLLEVLDCRNLRTIKYAVDCYARLVRTLGEKGHRHKDSLKLVELIFPCLAFSIGCKTYGLSASTLEKFSVSSSSMGTSYYLRQRNGDSANEPCEWGDFYKRVVTKSRNSISISSAFKLVCKGVLDCDALFNDLSPWGSDDDQPKDHIVNFNLRLTDEEFSDNVRSVISGMKDESLIVASSGELFRLCRNLHSIVENFGYDFPLAELEGVMSEYVSSVSESNSFEPSNVRFFGAEENNYLKELSGKLIKLENVRKELDEANRLQAALIGTLCSESQGSGDFFAQVYQGGTKPFITLELIDDLEKVLWGASAICVSEFSSLIFNRYDSINIFQFLRSEIPALKELNARVVKRIAIAPPSATAMELRRLGQVLDVALDKCHYDEVDN